MMRRWRQRCAGAHPGGAPCGGEVTGGHWFCAACFARLPVDFRRRLTEVPPFRARAVSEDARAWLVEHRPETLADRICGAG